MSVHGNASWPECSRSKRFLERRRHLSTHLGMVSCHRLSCNSWMILGGLWSRDLWLEAKSLQVIVIVQKGDTILPTSCGCTWLEWKTQPGQSRLQNCGPTGQRSQRRCQSELGASLSSGTRPWQASKILLSLEKCVTKRPQNRWKPQWGSLSLTECTWFLKALWLCNCHTGSRAVLMNGPLKTHSLVEKTLTGSTCHALVEVAAYFNWGDRQPKRLNKIGSLNSFCTPFQ